jgi:5-methylcytosine-specific restriction protein A
MPTKEEFREEIRARLRKAAGEEQKAVILDSRVIHRALGGYPGIDHRMPSCCEAMYDEMRAGDEIVEAPPKGRGATLRIRYRLPR